MTKRGKKRRRNQSNQGNRTFDSLVVDLPYADAVNVNSAVAGYAEYTFRLNDIFDPDATGTGHQPLGHDEFANIFYRYKVTHAKYEVWANSNASQQQLVGCVITRTSDALATRTEAMEHPTSQVKMLGLRNIENGVYMSGWCDIKKFDGKNNAEFSDTQYGAILGASPTKKTYLKVFVADVGSATSCDANFIVRITFKTRLMERNNLLQS